MRRVALVLWLVVVLIASSRWIGEAQAPAGGRGAAGGDDPRFTGRSETLDGKDLAVGRRSFEAGARAAWHSHEKGQLLFVEKGRARVQRKGESIKELRPGDSDYTPPNVVHWHGATPDQAYVQVQVSFGGDTKWLEKVTDEEYSGKKK
jgi:quercetin dioxygenase-like cupin family protein